MTDWKSLSARASLASHRLVGWIYWDPAAIAKYADLGVEGGAGYYIASRGAPLAPAGHQAVTAAFYSIHPAFIQVCLGLAEAATSWGAVTDARNAAVGEGLREFVPEICDDLAAMGPDLWAAADALPASGRVLFAAHRQWARPGSPPGPGLTGLPPLPARAPAGPAVGTRPARRWCPAAGRDSDWDGFQALRSP